MSNATPNIIKLAFVLAFVVSTMTPSKSIANVVGTGTQNFNPLTDGLDYVTVHSSKTLQPGIFNLGGFYNYAVNSLPYVDSSAQSRTQLSDTLTSSDFSVGLGVLPNVDIGMSIPAVLAQSVENRAGVRGQFGDVGNTELRFNSKWRFSGNDDGGYAVVASMNVSRTRNDPYNGDGAGPTYNLEFVADKTFSNKLSASFNAGHRFRNPGTAIAGAFIEPMRNQWIASIAASYLFEQYDTKLIAEVFGALPAQQQGTNPARDATSAEMLLGLKHDLTQQLALHGGGGTELKRRKFTKLTIEGHTDSVGRVAYNNDLSLRRANAIRDYLIKVENVPAEKIITAGLGPSRPIASNGNYQGRQANRRVEFLIER